jgi:hypothetical protein
MLDLYPPAPPPPALTLPPPPPPAITRKFTSTEVVGQVPAFLYSDCSERVQIPLAEDVDTVGGVVDITPPG